MNQPSIRKEQATLPVLLLIEKARQAQQQHEQKTATQLSFDYIDPNWREDDSHAFDPRRDRLAPDCYRLGKRGVRTNRKNK